MSSSNSPKFYIGLSVVLIGLLVLFLRESEIRSRAEAKARALEDKFQSMSAEKSTLVEELEVQTHELEGRLTDAQIRERELQAGHDAERVLLNAQIDQEKAVAAEVMKAKQAAQVTYEATLAVKDAELEAIQQRASAETAKRDHLIQEKSAENQAMATDLQKASEKYAALLQKKETIETQNLSLEKRVSELQASLDSVKKLATVEIKPSVQNVPAPAAVAVPTTADSFQVPA